jgi:glycosyltransferase involved in cell wall biosynthesis
LLNSTFKRSRILVMTSTFPRWKGDPEPAFVYELSRRLAVDFDITVLAPRAPGSLREEQMAGLRVIRFPYFLQRMETLAMHGGGILNNLKTNPLAYLLVPFFLIGQLLSLVQLLRREPFDLIHAHWIIPQGLTAVIARFITGRKIPLVCTSHGGDLYALRGRFFRWLKRIVINKSSALTVVSHAMRDIVVDMGTASEKVHVISMGVDLKHLFIPDPAVERNNHELLFVGRLVEKKGVAVLLRAMPAVLAEFPETRLTIAGSGPLEAELHRLAKELHISDAVDFPGMISQPQLPDLYRKAAIAVFPFIVAQSGDQEGFGLVQVEAMGCGCAVISGDLPVIHDIMIHEETGLLVPPGKPDALAEAVCTLLSNPDLRRRLAEQGRKRSIEQFDWSTVAGKYGLLYERTQRQTNN